jgi:hypothetical protein
MLRKNRREQSEPASRFGESGLYWPVASASASSMISRIRLVRRSMRITSRSTITRSQYSGKLGSWRSRSAGSGSGRFCRPGGNSPFFSSFLCSPAALGETGRQALRFRFLAAPIVLLDQPPFLGKKMPRPAFVARLSEAIIKKRRCYSTSEYQKRSSGLIHGFALVRNRYLLCPLPLATPLPLPPADTMPPFDPAELPEALTMPFRLLSP